MKHISSSRTALLFALMLAVPALLAGCGGSGGGGGTNTITTYTISGTVENASGAPFVGDGIFIGSTQVATTGTGGAFSFTLPAATLGSSATLTVKNGATSVGSVTVTPSEANASGIIVLQTITVTQSTTPTTDTVSGTLLDTSNDPIAGYTVLLSNSTETTTGTSGAFTFTVSTTALAASPILTIENGSGTVVYTETLTSALANGSGVVNLGSISINIATSGAQTTVTGIVYDFFTGLPVPNIAIDLNGSTIASTSSAGAVGTFSFQIPTANLANSPVITIPNTSFSESLTSSQAVSGVINLQQIYIVQAGEGAPP